MDHTYEEIRNIVIDILARREKVAYEPSQYEHVRLDRRTPSRTIQLLPLSAPPAAGKVIYCSGVFWDLFSRAITLGLNDSNRIYCSVSPFRKRILENQNTYFFHDLQSCTKLIRTNVPNINDVTLLYLQEAMQSFKSAYVGGDSHAQVSRHHSVLKPQQPARRMGHINVVQARSERLQKFRKFKETFDKHVL